jgi:hypothetical protein
MRALTGVTVVLLVTGCSSARAPAPPLTAAATPLVAPPAAAAVASGEGSAPLGLSVAPPRSPDPVPLSIRRIVSEQRSEIRDVLALTVPLPDPPGRARAAGEATALEAELHAIEAALDAEGPRSERFDETVVRLQRLATRVALLHEALFGAVAAKTALEVEIPR